VRILLTGFEPFAGRGVNPSWEAAQQLQAAAAGPARIDVLRVPVIWQQSVATITRELEREPADGLVIGGLSFGRPAISDALLATAPVRAIAQAINAAGIPAHVSWDGGAYVSNATLYGVLRYAKDRGLRLPTTYVHVPATPEMTTGTATPSLPLELIVNALRIGCEVVATHVGPDAPLRRWPSAMAPLPH